MTQTSSKLLNPALVSWPIVSASDEDTLVRLVTPYVRWVRPSIIQQLSQDNILHYDAWYAVLDKAEVFPQLYLWPGSACAYPGIRRKVGRSEQVGGVGAHSLMLDRSGNHLAHRTWELLAASANGFKTDRKGYELVHLFPHQAAEWRKLLQLLPEEIVDSLPSEWLKHLRAHGLPGLFSNPANTCFLPSALVRPTDGQSLLRQELWKHAISLYGSSTLLPPGVAVPFEQWLNSLPEPAALEWSHLYHGDQALFHKLLKDREAHLTRYQKPASTMPVKGN